MTPVSLCVSVSVSLSLICVVDTSVRMFECSDSKPKLRQYIAVSHVTRVAN